jgi:hypothetical protein
MPARQGKRPSGRPAEIGVRRAPAQIADALGLSVENANRSLAVLRKDGGPRLRPVALTRRLG